jgi:hypothetical protein
LGVPVWYFGEQILELIKYAKEHWYIAIPFVLILGGGILYLFHNATKIPDRKRRINTLGEEK